jgi:hypothetical protein
MGRIITALICAAGIILWALSALERLSLYAQIDKLCAGFMPQPRKSAANTESSAENDMGVLNRHVKTILDKSKDDYLDGGGGNGW